MIAAPLAMAATILLGVLESAGETPAEHLVLRIAADHTVVEAVRARLGPRLGAQHVGFDLTSTAAIDVEQVLAAAPERGPRAPIARGWIDGRDPDAVLLFLVPREADRVLARRIRLKEDGFDEVALVELTYILERAVASLRAAEPIGVPREQARAAVAAVVPAGPARPVQAPPPPSASSTAVLADPTRVAMGLAAFVGSGAWSSQTGAVASAGLSVMFERVSGGRRVGVSVSGDLRRSFDVQARPTDVRVGGGALHLLLTWGTRFGAWGVGRATLGPGLVVSQVEPLPESVSPGQIVTARPRTDIDMSLRVSPRWDLPIARAVSIFTAATIDVVPVRAEYTAIVNSSQAPLFSAWPVRPGFMVGIAVGVVD